MKERAALFQERSAPVTGSPDDFPTPLAADTSNSGLWFRLVARMRSWFEIPYGYEDEAGFHYGQQPPRRWQSEKFTDCASDAMTYPAALPKLISEDPSHAAETPDSDTITSKS